MYIVRNFIPHESKYVLRSRIVGNNLKINSVFLYYILLML